MLYGDIENVNLQDYVTYSKFRTITEDCCDVPKGLSEIPVIMELNKGSELKKKKGFPKLFLQDTIIFGYMRPDELLSNMIKKFKNSDKTVLLLNEFDKDRFLFIFRQADGTEEPKFFVKLNDVAELLSQCRNPNVFGFVK